MTTPTATARISSKKQTLEDAYSPPANFLEIDVSDPQTHGVAKRRYTDYEVRIKVNVPVVSVGDERGCFSFCYKFASPSFYSSCHQFLELDDE